MSLKKPNQKKYQVLKNLDLNNVVQIGTQKLDVDPCKCKDCKLIFGLTIWYNEINLPNIWKMAKKNEDLFIEVFTIIDTHERLHGLILESMRDQMEYIVQELHEDPYEVKKRFKRK